MKLVYGRAGTGKSSYCFNEIKKCIDSNFNGSLIYVVPEQYSLAAEFEMANALKMDGTINIQVLSFKRLAYRIFNELGFSKNSFSNASKNMLIYYLMLTEDKNLQVLKGSYKNRGLVDTVSNLISEFKRYNVSIESLKSLKIGNKYLEMKLHDLILIYERYEENISKEYIDTDSRLTKLSDLIGKSMMLKNAKIWIDEFDNFTPQELNIIEELYKVADVTVTFTLDKFSELFALNLKTFNKIRKLDDCEEIKLEKVCKYASNEIFHLEENIFKFPNQKYEKDLNDILVSMENNQYSEIDNVAKNIVDLVRENKYRYENIAVLTRNIDSYKSIFNRVFSSYNIPYFFDDKKELSRQPLLTLITSLFDIVSKNFSYENMFSYLKTALIDIDDENDIDLIENYVLQYGIRGNKWLSAWEYQSDNLEKINLIREKIISPIYKFKENLKGRKTVKEISTELYNFLIEVGVYKKITEKIEMIKSDNTLSSRELEIANTYIQVWNTFISLLDEITETLGDKNVSFETYKNILIEGISMHQIGILPTSNDHILIGDVSRTRNSNIKVLFVIGVNDGVFPLPFSSEGFLNDSERDALLESGVELAKNTKLLLLEENFNIYKALTVPTEKLYISFPTSDMSGNALRASSVINQMKNIFPKMNIKSNIICSDTGIYTPDSNFTSMLNNLRIYYDGNEIDDAWKNLYLWYKENWNEKISKVQTSLDYKNTIECIDSKHSKSLYGTNMNTSVSRLEAYANCPYMFYLRYGLKLKERKIFKLDTPDIGLYLHDIIDKFSEYVISNNINVRNIEREYSDEIVSRLIDDSLINFKDNIFNSSNQMKQLSIKLKRVIKRIVWMIVMHIKAGDFDITGSEVEFGQGKDIDAVKIELSDGNTLTLNGKIDRIDIAKTEEGKYIRIIDYKSYNKELKLSDIYYGLQLQLLVYLDAATEEDLLPGGMLYLKLDDPMIKSDKKVSKEEIEAEINKKLRMKGVILSDARLLKAMDNNMVKESSVLDLTIKNDGSFSSKVPCATKEQFADLRKHMRKILKQMGDEILSGNIKNEPIKKKGKSPCEFCDYKLICRFDKELGNKFKVINDLKNDEVFEQISL